MEEARASFVCSMHQTVCEHYLGKAEIKISLERAPLCRDDLVKNRRQKQSESHTQNHQEPSGDTAMSVKTVMLCVLKLLPDQ